MIRGQPTARTNLAFPTHGQCHGEAARNSGDFSGAYEHIFFNARAKVHARGVLALIIGQRGGGVNAFELQNYV